MPEQDCDSCIRVDPITFDGATPVDGYGPGFFRVAGQVYRGDMMITATGAAPWAGFADVDRVLAGRDDFDIVLVGTGPETAFPPRDFRNTLEQAGLSVEFMQTPAACRTYNVLLAEGRRVVALLLAV